MKTYKFELLAGMNLESTPSDHRLIRIVYRSDSDKAKSVGKKDSQGVIVPIITREMVYNLVEPLNTGLDTVNNVQLSDYIADWIISHCNKIQDDIARSRFEAGDKELADNYISMEAIHNAIKGIVSKERASVLRISDKSVKSWFDSHATKPLSVYFADKLGIAEDSVKISKVVEAYKSNMALLAGRTPIESSKLENLTKALEIIISSTGFQDDSGMVNKLLERIEILSEITDDDMLSIV